jgi:hypothetical protein
VIAGACVDVFCVSEFVGIELRVTGGVCVPVDAPAPTAVSPEDSSDNFSPLSLIIRRTRHVPYVMPHVVSASFVITGLVALAVLPQSCLICGMSVVIYVSLRGSMILEIV